MEAEARENWKISYGVDNDWLGGRHINIVYLTFMPKEKDRIQEQKKEEKCPLCDISEETLERLNQGGNKKIKEELVKNNGRTEGRK